MRSRCVILRINQLRNTRLEEIVLNFFQRLEQTDPRSRSAFSNSGSPVAVAIFFDHRDARVFLEEYLDKHWVGGTMM